MSLKMLCFNAEDLLDEIATEASRQKLQLQLHPTTGNLCNYFTSIVSPFHKEIESRIKELVDHLEFLANKRDQLGLKEGSGALTQAGVNRKEFKRLATTPLIDEADVYGREADKERIIEILLSPNMGGNQLPMDVIAIAGMGGMGKTTLARLIYKDQRMKDQFQHRLWMCISEEFDVAEATKSILQELDCPTKKSDDLTLCQRELNEKLMGKKIFLVLDDLWNENCQICEVFHAPFKDVAQGSKILVTTRNKKVAEVMHSTYIHLLKPLQVEDCWMLFAKHAFNEQHHGEDPYLVSIGRQIVEKCQGLPLAIKTLASLLYTKLSHRDWIEILESEIWNLSEDDSNIIPSLRLNYHYLPSNLKRCFAYCSIFPKDYVINKNVLIELWMAESLLHPSQTRESMEEVGNEIFNALESRSFFEASNQGGNYYIMHDLLNDLAKSVMGKFCLQLEGDWTQEISTETRYISCTTYLENAINFKDISMCHQLRSFPKLHNGYISFGSLFGLTRLKYMRALSLNEYRNAKRSINDIGNLKHLRYLDLSGSGIKKLPNSICLLINLQTLKLKNCYHLRKLPSKLHKLINLHHLDSEKCGITKTPKYMGKLNHLRTMTHFAVRRNKGYDLKELGPLNHLRAALTILNLENASDPMNAREANLKAKHLDKLHLQWGWIVDREVSQKQEHILDALEPNCNVKELFVGHYGGIRFPNWLGCSHLPNLVSVTLWYCTYCVNLPSLGQLPFLETLVIAGFQKLKVIGQEFYGNGSSTTPFQSFSSLSIWYMEEWEEWNICYEGDSFPCLEKLSIIDCPRLMMSLPQHLPSLKTLRIEGCTNLETSLPKASTMEKLWLESCEKISVKDMPSWCLTDVLPPLRDLIFINCPEIDALPQGDMLSNLQRLSIMNCPKLIASRKDWGLHELLSMEELIIGDDFEDTDSFPEEGLLPPNLVSLEFYQCLKLKRINHRGLLHLHSLTSLCFNRCPTMSLEGMPEDGLPSSLYEFRIIYCPLLEQRCQRETGPDWPKISHVRRVNI